jgi:hypothetical protein
MSIDPSPPHRRPRGTSRPRHSGRAGRDGGSPPPAARRRAELGAVLVGTLAIGGLVLTACSGSHHGTAATSGRPGSDSSGATTSGSSSSTNSASPSRSAAKSSAPGGSSQPAGSGGTTAPASGGLTISGGVEVPTGSAAGDPCKITTSAKVTAALGGSLVTETAGTSGTGAETCHFVLTRTRITPSLAVEMSLTTHESQATFDQVKKAQKAESISGVGQDAYYRADQHTIGFFVNGTVVTVAAAPTPASLSSSQASALRSDMISLARVIAAQQ